MPKSLLDENDKLKDCVKLMYSILNNSNFKVETPNEGALVVAMDLAGYPLKVLVNQDYNRDINKDYEIFLEEKYAKFKLKED